jgi:NADH-quinone oxidoreductase subunit F
VKLEELRRQAAITWNGINQPSRPQIFIGQATCGEAAGASETAQAIGDALARLGIEADVMGSGCLGACYCEPLVDIIKPGYARITFHSVTADKAADLIEKYLGEGVIPPEMVLGDWAGGRVGVPDLFKTPMFNGQVRLALRNAGHIDPRSLLHYLARDGYMGLERAFKMTPEAVIAEIELAGLRGRGGAGFPTATKWKLCRQAKGDSKYLICNADEGDPGAFMNRALLESDPHSVLEGILIGAYAIGAGEGFIYTRAEYPLAIKRLEGAIEQARAAGLLGKDILGSGFAFDIKIIEGAGAFVCGEETAMIASIEGYRGTPRPRPPFPASSGLWGKPTNINNVETWSHVSFILKEGAAAFNSFGTARSKGTKTFSLAGKVMRTGLIEVPLGTTLEQIIVNIGGGVAQGKSIKAVQIGGPSGGCLPASMLDFPVDYEDLTRAGVIMGSGGIIVLDDDDCMVDTARYFLTFTRSESCGKCSPCRIGTRLMLRILESISSGHGRTEDLPLLAELARSIKASSLCGLGQGAPNPVLTTLAYFGDEYRAHIEGSCCPALVCRSLVNYTIDIDRCRGCGLCFQRCPTGAVSGIKGQVYAIDKDKCNLCGACLAACPSRFGAVTRVSGRPVAAAA